ncbi:hypothetical protein OC834_005836 [Tilletia horrida]|uniref:Endo-1,3(4)-beta-glucanase 1 carbohydrate binding domain-containing protein n=1 Tax=Tilletia horrida TaxID=155126 RepID=A0AAN6JJ80_9BASI|nr:hypothetical protein OC834_005836 [Tilletia horrida]KAK0526204.1 hypothetical protein OC842_005258 [Tilletia horrida]KAK0539552.1 hypothetical protein OC835_001104 [Tilletia horrida]KAK0564985.1 hypothetical protein OC844_001439 [Tilletia horrida]
MQVIRVVLAVAASAVAVSAAAVQPAERLAAPATTAPAGPPGTAPVAGTVCFDNFDCLFGGGGQGSVCSKGKCYTTTTAGPTSTKGTKPPKTSSVSLPAGVPTGYHLVAGRGCFDAFDCLLGNFTDTTQKCSGGKCYSKY